MRLHISITYFFNLFNINRLLKIYKKKFLKLIIKTKDISFYYKLIHNNYSVCKFLILQKKKKSAVGKNQKSHKSRNDYHLNCKFLRQREEKRIIERIE